MSVIGLSLVCVFVAGFALGRATASQGEQWDKVPTVVEDDAEPKVWRHAMPPDRYLKQHPAGPFADHARRVLSRNH